MDKIPQLSDKLVPSDYIQMSSDEKEVAHNFAYMQIWKTIKTAIPDSNSRIPILETIIDNSVQMHENEEEYEICQFWVDFKYYVGELIMKEDATFINEQ